MAPNEESLEKVKLFKLHELQYMHGLYLLKLLKKISRNVKIMAVKWRNLIVITQTFCTITKI